MTPQEAYQQFLSQGYWPDEQTRSLGMQWLAQDQMGQSSAANQLLGQNAYGWNGETQQYMAPNTTPAPSTGSSVFGGVPTGTTSMAQYYGSQPATATGPVAQPGTSTAQGYTGGALAPGMPAPLGGAAPLTDAVKQGWGMGLAPFNTQWYDQLGQSLYSQANQNFTENINPQIQGGAQLAGQYGGNRAAIAQGQALGQLNQNVMNAMAPQYAGGYENWLNRGVGVGNSAMQGLLGLGNLDLGAYQADTNRTLGQGALDVSRYNAQTNAGLANLQASGQPIYNNPWGSALAGAIGTYGLQKLWGG